MDMTLADAATRLGVSPTTLRVQVNKGRLAARLMGKTYVVTEAEVERYGRDNRRGSMVTCPRCGGAYGRTYEQHTGSERHRAAVRAAVGR